MYNLVEKILKPEKVRLSTIPTGNAFLLNNRIYVVFSKGYDTDVLKLDTLTRTYLGEETKVWPIKITTIEYVRLT